MKARTIFAVGALALVLVLVAAPRAGAGGIVYWGGTRVVSTGTPVVTAPSTTAHVAGKAYETGYKEGYETGYRDGAVTGTGRTVVTRTVVTPTYTVPTRTVYTYTSPTVVVHRRSFVTVPYVRTVPCLPRWRPVYRRPCLPRWRPVYRRPYCRRGSALVIRW
jgi:hypothetical protein